MLTDGVFTQRSNSVVHPKVQITPSAEGTTLGRCSIVAERCVIDGTLRIGDYDDPGAAISRVARDGTAAATAARVRGPVVGAVSVAAAGLAVPAVGPPAPPPPPA